MNSMKLSEFEKRVSSSILNLECIAENDHYFEGGFAEKRLGQLTICEINAPRHRVVRRPMNSAQEGIVVTSVKSGECYLEREYDQFDFHEGSAFFCRASEFYSIETSDRVDLKTLYIPQSKLSVSESIFLSKKDSKLKPYIDPAFFALINPYLDLVSPPDNSLSNYVESSFLSLISGVLSANDDSDIVQSSDHVSYLLKEMIVLVESHLKQEYLSPEFIAKKMGYSSRYLNKILSTKGLSLLKLIFQMRMDHIMEDLVSPEKSKKTICFIASDYCFYDNAYFSRQFKAYTGLSPKEYRLTHNPVLHC
ncbi:MAG: helix-turn-helix domain-containing protein [Oceanospirillaceae bacterium]|nr:helix-turn-helix domain-containing protein [Oceanospirillaceae bacterium]